MKKVINRIIPMLKLYIAIQTNTIHNYYEKKY
jgi:hypothetical protein